MRCRWCNLNNPLYVKYHDEEWGVVNHDDKYLFEMLILEGFQAGLSWECILNKRESFRKAFDNFDYNVIKNYDNNKIEELMNNKNIVRNRRKIEATIINAKCFIDVINEYGTFDNFIWSFSDNKIIKNKDDIFKTTSDLSDLVSKSLIKRGFKFIGSTIIYSYLQAIGIINDHELSCFKF